MARWRRKGFRLYWTWKSQRRGAGRPAISLETHVLIHRVSLENPLNPLWGAPRVQGEVQMLGTDAPKTTLAKYMIRHRKAPSQTFRTFLANHVKELMSVDFVTDPTATFCILYVFLVLRHERRQVAHFKTSPNTPRPSGRHSR